MVRALTYFRYKRQVLGSAYERFLASHLEPGGTIIISDCRRMWPTTSLGSRHVFQHGAVGGAAEEEFHHGGARVAEYLERYESPMRRWTGPDPDSLSPEAEWGFAPALGEDIERFAREHGYRVRRLSFDTRRGPARWSPTCTAGGTAGAGSRRTGCSSSRSSCWRRGGRCVPGPYRSG